MLARCCVPLPVPVYQPAGATLPARTVVDGRLEVRYRGFWLLRAPTDYAPATIEAENAEVKDALWIDFYQESFDRRETADRVPDDDTIERHAVSFCDRLRYVTHFPLLEVRGEFNYHVAYLQDDGSPFESEEGLVRGFVRCNYHIRGIGMTTTTWAHCFPTESIPPWEELVLDAFKTLPVEDGAVKAGPAIVLAWTALEMLMDAFLPIFASANSTNHRIYRWLENRGAGKDLSTREKLNQLLFWLSGLSLPEGHPHVWQGLCRLNEARNNFVHRGEPYFTENNQKQPLTWSSTHELLRYALATIRLVREAAPEEHRWPVFSERKSLQLHVVLPTETYDLSGPA